MHPQQAIRLLNCEEITSYEIDYTPVSALSMKRLEIVEFKGASGLSGILRADALGAGGRRFESGRPDQWNNSFIYRTGIESARTRSSVHKTQVAVESLRRRV